MWKILNELKCDRDTKVFIGILLWFVIILFTTVPITYLYENEILTEWLFVPLLLISVSWYLFYFIFNVDEKLK